tara:strand:+ start:166 stop:1245 length:1080 start_codon:yes stop_codon:yes gene_type:complete
MKSFVHTGLAIFSISLAVSSLASDTIAVDRFAALALDCVHQEYPNHISHSLQSDSDVRPPRELTPAFYGCLDWHSSVHGHWLLVRLARLYPETQYAEAARSALAQSLTETNLLAETHYVSAKGRRSFERPYGIVWLLQLAAELEEWDDPQAAAWRDNIRPLESALVKRLTSWLPDLTYPVRSGTHSQTAFALGLALDWARTTEDKATEALLVERAQTLYRGDTDCPLYYEPSGADFLSPCLAEADLMRRVLTPPAFSSWLDAFLSIPDRGKWFEPAIVSDRSDPHLVHLDGLNLSRAWMLEGIASALPPADPRVTVLQRTAKAHRDAGLEGVNPEYYAGSHWLGSFATYLVTERGISER